MMLRPLTLPLRKIEDASALQLADDLDRDLVALGAADDGAEAGHAAVDQLDAPGPELDVVDGAIELHLVAVGREGARSEAFAMLLAVAELDDLRLLLAHEAHPLDHLFGEEGGDAAVEGLAEIGQPHGVGGQGVEKRPGPLEDGRQVAEGLDLASREGVDDGQEVGGVGERDGGLWPELFDGLVDHRLSLGDDGAGAADGALGDVAAHRSSPSTWV